MKEAMLAMEAAKLEAVAAKLRLEEIEATAELKAALREINEAKEELEVTVTGRVLTCNPPLHAHGARCLAAVTLFLRAPKPPDAERELKDRKYREAMNTLDARVHRVLPSQPGGGPDDLFTMEVSSFKFGAKWSIRRKVRRPPPRTRVDCSVVSPTAPGTREIMWERCVHPSDI